MRRLLATLAFTAFTGCSGIGGVGEQIDGTWVGSSAGTSITMQLVQNWRRDRHRDISPAVPVRRGRCPSQGTTDADPDRDPHRPYAERHDPARRDGPGKTMVGTLTGSEFAAEAIALTRQ